jgi:hypothetical protein
MLLRLLSTALCAICVVLLATSKPVRVVMLPQHAPLDASTPVSVVDVAAGVPARDLPALIRLRHGERVIAINDRPIAGNLEAGGEIASSGLAPGGFLDVAIAGGRAERRVLMLMH